MTTRPELPVGFGVGAQVITGLTGSFANPDPVCVQSTGFVLATAGKVVVSVYSGGAIDRLVPDDVAGLVRCLREAAATSASHEGRLLFGQEAVPVGSCDQGGADAAA